MAASSRGDLSRISGPDSMQKPSTSAAAGDGNGTGGNGTTAASSSSARPKDDGKAKRKKRNKKKNRRQSFITPSEAATETADDTDRPTLLETQRAKSSQQASFYRLQNGGRSNTSLESEALLDHREHTSMRSRRDTIKSSLARVALPFSRQQHRSSNADTPMRSGAQRTRLSHAQENAISDDDEDQGSHERSPLLASDIRNRNNPQLSRSNSGFGYGSNRRQSNTSKASSRRRVEIGTHAHNTLIEEPHDVNNPPSVPGSPTLGSMDDMFLAGASSDRGRDAVIEIEGDRLGDRRWSSTSLEGTRRRATVAELAERDVCFPGDDDDISEIAEESTRHSRHGSKTRSRRRRGVHWPDLDVLEEWSREEKEERTQQEVQRAKKISEPVMVGGRMRAPKTPWHREEDDAPFRYTYFNETLDGTIHARTISDLQDDMTFKELFLPDPVELSDSSESEDEEPNEKDSSLERRTLRSHRSISDAGIEQLAPLDKNDHANQHRTASIISKSVIDSAPASGHATPKPKRKRYGSRPTFWLDVLKPTEAEMKVLAKAFGIHQLTTEDILMDEQREKVELFQSYYFVNYRTFEQDKDSEDYLEPINMYVVVFRHGVISFHHSMSPHPANVRRRIRQLKDYLIPSPDWISYAIIDDITDVYAPQVTQIEQEVDDIDEDILYMHTAAVDQAVAASNGNKSQRPQTSNGPGEKRRGSGPAQNQGDTKAESEKTATESGGDMLRRVGVCRKNVMLLYRLLGNKADVIKGFAKRCNEHWDVAPRSEIGLYLGDIQDHIVTMTGNLSHYESLLSRAHGNYMAQINIRMNERAELNADILGKLTVLGTIVLPMNIITGMWGMNVWVPGQDSEGDLTWFFGITAGLVAFGLTCYFIARKVYGIV